MTLKSHAINAYLKSMPAVKSWHRMRRRVGRGRRTVTFYHQVDDPRSHLVLLALQRARFNGEAASASFGPAERGSGALHVRIVVVPEPAADANPAPLLRQRYVWADSAQLAARFDLPLPSGVRERTPDRLRRAHAVLLSGSNPDDALSVARTVGEALLGEGSLGDAVAAYGASPGHAIRPLLEANYSALRKRGHYEGGTLYYEGEWYGGLDRVDYLFERLRAEGLEVQSPSYRSPGAPFLHGALKLYVSFRSPYSYLAVARLADQTMRPTLRPVLPMVTRGLQVPKTKARYLVRDAAREAARLNIPFGRISDPLGAGVERAMAVFFAAESIGSEWVFAEAAMRGTWSEGRDLAGEGLYIAAQAADLSPDDVDAALADEGWRKRVEAHRRQLGDAGLWGVPAFVGPNTRLWGQDRIAWLGSR